MKISLIVKLRVCWHVLTERSVFFNLHFFGKVRIRRPGDDRLSVWVNTFENFTQGQDNFMVLPDDLPRKVFQPQEADC